MNSVTPIIITHNLGSMRVRRGPYSEIQSVGDIPAAAIIEHFRDCLPERFIEFDSKRRGDALNLDLYGYCPEQEVAVIQVRHAFRRYRNSYLNVRKDYVLVGYNEITELPFRHPVSANAVRAGVRAAPDDPSSAVRAAQRWMWGVSDAQLSKSLRQGDVLLVPLRRRPIGKKIGTDRHLLGGSHEIRAREIVVDGAGGVFAWAPALWHVKGQHDPIYAESETWYQVKIARETETWDWSVRLGD
jgi:hypothetical protein